MAAFVVINLVTVFSRSAAAVMGSVITEASAILLFPSLRWFCVGRFLLGCLRCFPWLRARRRASLHNQPLDVVQFGIQVVQAHFDVGHALRNRDNVSAGWHGQLLECLE